MGFFFQGYTVTTIIGVIVLIAGLILINEITRRSKSTSIAFYCILPVVLVILIATNVVSSPASETWFGVIKTYSALAGVIGFMIIRYTKAANTKFAWIFPGLILQINIIEAIIKEVEVYFAFPEMAIDEAGLVVMGGSWNIMNVIAGILLLLSLTGWMGIKVAKTKSQDMVWPDQIWVYIIAYDFWNMAYCYNAISTRAMFAGFVLLAACTLAEVIFKRGAWLQHRAQTLALFGMFSLAFDYQAMPIFGITATYNPTAWFALSAASLVVNAAAFIYIVYRSVKFKRNPYTKDIFAETKSYEKNLEANNLLEK